MAWLELMLFLVISLFFVLLAIKEITSKGFCVLCAAIFGTWLVFLALYWLGIFEDIIILALFMGQSILGVFYLAEKKFGNRLALFRLPFLLTLTIAAYAALSFRSITGNAILLLLGLWAAFIIIFAGRHNKKVNKLLTKIIACCRNW